MTNCGGVSCHRATVNNDDGQCDHKDCDNIAPLCFSFFPFPGERQSRSSSCGRSPEALLESRMVRSGLPFLVHGWKPRRACNTAEAQTTNTQAGPATAERIDAWRRRSSLARATIIESAACGAPCLVLLYAHIVTSRKLLLAWRALRGQQVAAYPPLVFVMGSERCAFARLLRAALPCALPNVAAQQCVVPSETTC